MPAEYGFCDQCDDRVELVPVAGGEALACCRCDAIVGGGLA